MTRLHLIIMAIAVLAVAGTAIICMCSSTEPVGEYSAVIPVQPITVEAATLSSQPQSREPAPSQGIERRMLRFVNGDGMAIPKVGLYEESSRPSLAIASHPIGLADEDGCFVCDGLARNVVAMATNMLPTSTQTYGWSGVRDIIMKNGSVFDVWCIDDKGVPLSGCVVAIQSRDIKPNLPALDSEEQDDNPLVKGYRCVRRTNELGKATLMVVDEGPLLVKAVHRWYTATSPEVVNGTDVDVRSRLLLVRMVPVRGVIAAPPAEVPITSWSFDVMPKPERAGRGLSEQIARRLEKDHPGCGIRVLAAPGQADEGKYPERVVVRASAIDGSLWGCECVAQRLTQDVIPVQVAPMAVGTGWLRVDITGQNVDLNGMPLRVTGSGGGEWWCQSGRAIQLPVGDYYISPPMMPGLDEILDKAIARVVPGNRYAPVTVIAAMPVAVGRVDITVDMGANESEASPSLSIVLEDGGSMTQCKFLGGNIALPVGTHKLTVSAVGFSPSVREVAVVQNQVTSVHCRLAEMP